MQTSYATSSPTARQRRSFARRTRTLWTSTTSMARTSRGQILTSRWPSSCSSVSVKARMSSVSSMDILASSSAQPIERFTLPVVRGTEPRCFLGCPPRIVSLLTSVSTHRVSGVTYEATDLLVFKRPINTGSHLVLYQVGIVGKSNFKFDTSDENVHFNKLLDRLEEAYGSSHIVTHYIAPLFPTEEPTAEEYTIAQLRLTEIQDKIHTISTFYVPPKASKSIVYDETLLAALGVTHKPSVPYPWNPEAAPYGPRERNAIELLAEHQPPKGYRPLKERSGLLTVLEKLCLEPVEMKKYNEDRRAYADNLKVLTKAEKDALVSGDHRNLAGALKVGDTPTNPAALVFTFIITRLD